FVLVDIRPGYPGGQFPITGAIRLRSFNRILVFLAAAIKDVPEFEVAPDPRSDRSSPNPPRTLGIDVTESEPNGSTLSIAYGGKFYSVAPTAWDRDAFKLLHELFQMTVTESAKAVAPAITIGK